MFSLSPSHLYLSHIPTKTRRRAATSSRCQSPTFSRQAGWTRKTSHA